MDFEDFAQLARVFGGSDAAIRKLREGGELSELLEEYARKYEEHVKRVRSGYPPQIIALPHQEPWYAGPVAGDRQWPALEAFLRAHDSGWDGERMERLDAASSKIVAYTPNVSKLAWKSRGLIVGHVQSGKTTNFTAVIAKAVDVGYNFIVVMSGIHNGLRRQTQERMQEQLLNHNADLWVSLTTADCDFRKQTMALGSVLKNEPGHAVICVVKKNPQVLRKLKQWLQEAQHTGDMRKARALVIDDEADQVSVATPIINPLVRDILGLAPRCTYLGYTATPFANVLIDPSVDDLYPKDFILNLPCPDGYFGAEMIFGRDEIPELGARGASVDGHDMVRLVSDDEVHELRRTSSGGGAQPIVASMVQAIRWFWLATAARRARHDVDHSSMLIHTSMKTAVHHATARDIRDMTGEVAAKLRAGDGALVDEFRQLWDSESARVSASTFGNEPVCFEALLAPLLDVVAETRVVVDNSTSLERLQYVDGEPAVTIAVGGNTLSRGLTLEGLVVSYFIRSATAYDTLLQMGRWFGFRNGYEELPRIWMTDELKRWFRHLSLVEHEVRVDIARYEQQAMSPMEVGVRIRRHPALLVTQKLGAARLSEASYGGRRVQTRYFYEQDRDWLAANRRAADILVTDLNRTEPEAREDGALLWRHVDVAHVVSFLRNYSVSDDSPDLNRKLVLEYIEKELESGSLRKWSVAVMGGTDAATGTIRLGGREVARITRAKLKGTGPSPADIKTLMSKEHRVVDLNVSPGEARKLPEGKLMDLRNDDPVLKSQGLLLLYPVHPQSNPDPANRSTRDPLAALDDVIGVGMVFPGNADHFVVNSYISIDHALAACVEESDVDPLSADTEDPANGQAG